MSHEANADCRRMREDAAREFHPRLKRWQVKARKQLLAADAALMLANEAIVRGQGRSTCALRCITEAQFQIMDAITHSTTIPR